MAKLKECFLCILINFIIIGNDVAFSERYDKREEATMIFTGDMTFDGPVKYFAEVKGTCDYKRPFDRIREEMQGADLRVGNLESPLINSAMEAKKLLPNKNIHQRGLPKAADGLKYAGFDVVQLANNHMADYGNSGMKSTIKALKHYGIDYVGVTDKFDTAGKQKGFVRTINGVRIGMLAYCWNYDGCRAPKCGPNDPCDGNHKMLETGPTVFIKTVALKEISKMKRRVDILVVLMHWGKEVTVIPAMSTRLIAHEIKLAGANLIIGSHPHVIQVNAINSIIYNYSLCKPFIKYFIVSNAKRIDKLLLGSRMPWKVDSICLQFRKLSLSETRINNEAIPGW